MNGTDLNQQKAVLMVVRKMIVQKSHQREAIWVAQSNKLMGTAQLAVEWDFAVRSLDLENRWLRQIDAALKRIDDGEFGTCLESEEPISPKRLTAVPWATYRSEERRVGQEC